VDQRRDDDAAFQFFPVVADRAIRPIDVFGREECDIGLYSADKGHLRDSMILEEFGHFLFSRLGIFRCPIRLDIVRFDFLRLKLYALHESKHKVVG
jgi:hypothetical protein